MARHGQQGNNWLYIMRRHADRLMFGTDALAVGIKAHGDAAYAMNARAMYPIFDILDEAENHNIDGSAGITQKIGRTNYEKIFHDPDIERRRHAWEDYLATEKTAESSAQVHPQQFTTNQANPLLTAAKTTPPGPPHTTTAPKPATAPAPPPSQPAPTTSGPAPRLTISRPRAESATSPPPPQQKPTDESDQPTQQEQLPFPRTAAPELPTIGEAAEEPADAEPDDQEPQWWYEGTRNRPEEPYAPSRRQQAWLTDNNLQVGWVDADGDCVFAATVRTIGPTRIAGAMNRISDRVGLPRPDLAGRPVTGRDLRLFLADVIEHAVATSNTELIESLNLSRFLVDVGDDTSDVTTLSVLLAGLREFGDYSERSGGDSFSALLHLLLNLADLRLGWISDESTPIAGPDGRREQYTIVHVNEHYLPTYERDGAPPEAPEPAAATRVDGPLTDPAPWRLQDDQSYLVEPGAAATVRELPVSLHAGPTTGTTLGGRLRDAVLQMVRSVEHNVTSDGLLQALPGLAGENPQLTDALLTALAARYEMRIQQLHTDGDGHIVAGTPVGDATAPIRYLHHDQATDSYRSLRRDLPGLGRAYTPPTRRSTPTLALPSGRRTELPQATWYHQGQPSPASQDRVASHHTDPRPADRLHRRPRHPHNPTAARRRASRPQPDPHRQQGEHHPRRVRRSQHRRAAPIPGTGP